MPMNIALFTDSYIPTKSGVVTVVLQLRKVLTEMGHHVVIVTVDADGYNDPELNSDPDILRIKSIPTPFHIPDQYIGFPFEKEILNFLRKNNIQIIHSHTEFFVAHAAKESGRKLHIPVIATTHTLWEDFYIYYLPMGKLIPVSMIRQGVRRLYKKFYALVNVSQKAYDYFKMPFMLPNTPSAIIPNALDGSRFLEKTVSRETREQLRKDWGVKKDDVLLMFVGRVVEEKRVVELLEICLRVLGKQDNIKMMFVGAGGAIHSLEKRTREAGADSRIMFTGYVTWENIHSYYALGDIFITTSLSEMHSMTVLEALMSSLPIIARQDTSFSDTIIPGENGYLANSDEEMDDLILDLVNNPEKRSLFAKNSYELSKKFSPKTFGKRTIAFYEKVLATYPEKLTDEDLRKAVESVSAE